MMRHFYIVILCVIGCSAPFSSRQPAECSHFTGSSSTFARNCPATSKSVIGFCDVVDGSLVQSSPTQRAPDTLGWSCTARPYDPVEGADICVSLDCE